MRRGWRDSAVRRVDVAGVAVRVATGDIAVLDVDVVDPDAAHHLGPVIRGMLAAVGSR